MVAGDPFTHEVAMILERDLGYLVEEKTFIQDAHGADHEIDVLATSRESEPFRVKFLVECKDWQRKVDSPVARSVAYFKDNSAYDKCLIIARIGFSENVKRIAKAKGVGLLRLEDLLSIVHGCDPMVPKDVGIALSRKVITAARGDQEVIRAFVDCATRNRATREENSHITHSHSSC